MKPKVLVTGVTGFVGSLVAEDAARAGFEVIGVSRKPVNSFYKSVLINSFEELSDPSDLFRDVGMVVHCAARAHIMKDEVPDPLAEYRKVNVDGTLKLARQAAEAGVRRFVFISSIKVNGEKTSSNQPFTAQDAPAPEDAYGISKMEAEQGLQTLAAETGIEVVIIRPPLVYGAGVKGNFASMIKMVEKGLPLPMGAIHNKRSLVALENLVDLIITCIDHHAAANQVFLVGDGEDLSTTELLQGVASAMGQPSRLVPVPAALLMLGATVLGKKAIAQRLLGSLQVDISKTRNLLGWQPPLSVEEGLKRCFSDR